MVSPPVAPRKGDHAKADPPKTSEEEAFRDLSPSQLKDELSKIDDALTSLEHCAASEGLLAPLRHRKELLRSALQATKVPGKKLDQALYLERKAVEHCTSLESQLAAAEDSVRKLSEELNAARKAVETAKQEVLMVKRKYPKPIKMRSRRPRQRISCRATRFARWHPASHPTCKNTTSHLRTRLACKNGFEPS